MRAVGAPPLINTPLQRGDRQWRGTKNRFNGFGTVWETVQTVPESSAAPHTPLKRGVNEIGWGGREMFVEKISNWHKRLFQRNKAFRLDDLLARRGQDPLDVGLHFCSWL